MPRHFNALTDLRFCLCHLCVMFLLLYPVPSHPVSSRNGSETLRICPSSLFSTLMCCYWCLLQTDTGHASKICSMHNLLYTGETAVCCTELISTEYLHFKANVPAAFQGISPSIRDSGWTVSDVKEKVHQYWLRGRATLPHL